MARWIQSDDGKVECPICHCLYRKRKNQRTEYCSSACRKEGTKRQREDEERVRLMMRGKVYDNPCRVCGEPTGHNYFFCIKHAALVREPYI